MNECPTKTVSLYLTQIKYSVMTPEHPIDPTDFSQCMIGHLGIRFHTISPEVVEAFMPVDVRTSQPFGLLNGGASLALAENVAGYGSMLLCAPDQIAVGAEVSAHHLASIAVGTEVKATATLLHKGNLTHLWNIDVTAPEGRLLSTIRVLNIIKKRR